MRISSTLLATVSALALTFVVGCSGGSDDESVEGLDEADTTVEAQDMPDGLASDSASSTACSPGYYYCWSSVQQKNVCTTRKCFTTGN